MNNVYKGAIYNVIKSDCWPSLLLALPFLLMPGLPLLWHTCCPSLLLTLPLLLTPGLPLLWRTCCPSLVGALSPVGVWPPSPPGYLLSLTAATPDLARAWPAIALGIVLLFSLFGAWPCRIYANITYTASFLGKQGKHYPRSPSPKLQSN